jgi:uncharacterized protein
MRFEWDPAKAKSNLDKHGVSFEFACGVFADPFAIERFDDQRTGDEDRYIIIGSADGVIVLLVVYTDRENVTQIISARRATRRERNDYEDQKTSGPFAASDDRRTGRGGRAIRP